MNLTKHGAMRQQQRGIPDSTLNLLLQYGKHEFDHHGGVIRYFDRRGKKLIEQQMGKDFVKRHHQLFNTYLVQSASDDYVITCGHRQTKIFKH